MSDFMVTEIATALIDILADSADLADVKLFIRGGNPYSVPTDLQPYCEVIIGEEVPNERYTGESAQTYTGVITFTAQLTQQSNADWLSSVGTDARRSYVASYDLIKRLIMATQSELQRAVHCSLNSLTTSTALDALTVDEVVTSFRLEGAIAYGLDARDNNYENFGSMAFIVETERTITEGA